MESALTAIARRDHRCLAVPHPTNRTHPLPPMSLSLVVLYYDIEEGKKERKRKALGSQTTVRGEGGGGKGRRDLFSSLPSFLAVRTWRARGVDRSTRERESDCCGTHVSCNNKTIMDFFQVLHDVTFKVACREGKHCERMFSLIKRPFSS